MKGLVYIFSFLIIFSVEAQSLTSGLGRFQVPYAKGCVPFTVSVEKIGNFSVEPQYIYEEGLTETLDTFYTYTQPGIYEIIQIFNAGDPTTDTLYVEVFEPVEPSYKLIYCDESTVEVRILDTYYDSFEISSSDTLITTGQNSSALLNLPVGQTSTINVEGFLNNAFPNCGALSQAIIPQPLSLNFELLNFDPGYICDNELEIDLEFNYDENTEYSISYSNGDFTNQLLQNTLDSGFLHFEPVPLPYPDSSICISIDAVATCSGNVVSGISDCQQLPRNFTAIDFAYVSYENEDIRLTFENNENGLVKVEKWTEDILVNQWDSITNGFLDTSISPLRQYSYDLIFIPACGADTQRIELNPPYVEKRFIKPNSFEISWSDGRYVLNNTPLNQIIIQNQLDSTEFRAIRSPLNRESVTLSNEFGPQQEIYFEQVFSDLGISLKSNRLPIPYEYVVFVPKAFTPNNDGLNDVLEVFGIPTDNFRMLIYNKWGEVIHTCTSSEEFWDGSTPNRPNQTAQSGVYTYYIEYESQEGELYSQRGTFMVILN